MRAFSARLCSEYWCSGGIKLKWKGSDTISSSAFPPSCFFPVSSLKMVLHACTPTFQNACGRSQLQRQPACVCWLSLHQWVKIKGFSDRRVPHPLLFPPAWSLRDREVYGSATLESAPRRAPQACLRTYLERPTNDPACLSLSPLTSHGGKWQMCPNGTQKKMAVSFITAGISVCVCVCKFCPCGIIQNRTLSSRKCWLKKKKVWPYPSLQPSIHASRPQSVPLLCHSQALETFASL